MDQWCKQSRLHSQNKATPVYPSAHTGRISHPTARKWDPWKQYNLIICSIFPSKPIGRALQYQVHVELKEIIKCNLITKLHLLLITHSCQKHLRFYFIVSKELRTGKIKDGQGGVGGRENSGLWKSEPKLMSVFENLANLQVYFLFPMEYYLKY